MNISSSVSRITDYFKRNGLLATVRRVGLAAQRALFASRSVLFYCDLSTLKPPTAGLPSLLKVVRHASQSEISPADLQEITSFWNPDQARRNLKQRFELGASLWLIKLEDHLTGYGWTLRGRTVEPHYIRLAPEDIHLFDFHVFPQYRGRGLNPFLVNRILRDLAAETSGRAFIEAAEWNQAQLSSLKKTPFRFLGSARKLTILGRTIVWWARDHAAEQERKSKKASRAVRGRKRSSVSDLQA